jgi:hypothetical protein
MKDNGTARGGLFGLPAALSASLAAAALAALALSGSACRDDTTTAPGAVANVTFDSPDTAHSGQSVQVDVQAVNAGINGIHNGRMDVTLPSPLQVDSVSASDGSATFSNGSGATVTWMMGTLDSNSQSRLHIHVTGTLPGSLAMSLTMRASMTADGIRAGDAVAEKTLVLVP